MNSSQKRVLMISLIAVVLGVSAYLSVAQENPSNSAEMKKGEVVKEIKSDGEKKSILRQGKIVFFTQDGCGYCTIAKEYIDKEYPNLAIDIVNIGSKAGHRRLVEVARKKRIRQVATPLILLGSDEYILGWGESNKEKFKKYVDNLQ